MARYFPHARQPDGETSGTFIPHAHRDVGAVHEGATDISGLGQYLDIPGYIGAVEMKGKIPTWAMIAGGLGVAWYMGVNLPIIGKRKK